MWADLVRRAEQIIRDEIRNGEARDVSTSAEWNDRVIRMAHWLREMDRKLVSREAAP